MTRFSGSAARVAALFLVGLLFTRVIFLLAALDPAEERVMEVLDPSGKAWSHGPICPLYDKEELYIGSAAEAMIQGSAFPISAYRFMPYGSATIAMTLAVVPLFRLFGPTYLALKVVPLILTLLGGLGWLLVVRAWMGKRTGLIFALAYILAPPILTRTTLLEMGGHPLAMAWIGWVALLGTVAWQRSQSRRGKVLAAATGAVAGLGVWMSYSTIPIVAAFAVSALWITKCRPRSIWIAAGLGLLLGLIPWLVVVAGTSGAALHIYGRSLGALANGSQVVGRFGTILSTGFAAGYDLPGGAAVRSIAGWIWLFAIGLGSYCLVRSPRKNLALLVGAGTIAHLIGFILLAPDASSRYLLPVYPLLLLLATASFSVPPSPNGVRARQVSSGFVWAVAALGLCSQAAVIFTSAFPPLRVPLKGTYWPLFGEFMGRKMTAEGIRSMPQAMQPFLWLGYGERLCLDIDPSKWRSETTEAGPDSARVWEGIGIPLLSTSGPSFAAGVLGSLAPKSRFFLARGLSYSASHMLASMVVNNPRSIPVLFRSLGPANREVLSIPLACAEGVLGTQTGDDFAHSVGDPLAEGERIRGIGWSLYRGLTPQGTLRFWKTPQADAPIALWEGVAEAYEWDLRVRSNEWLIGDMTAGPRSLARELLILTRALSPDRASLFYRAAGRATAAAAQEPSRRAIRDWSGWRWRAVIPPAYQQDFGKGLVEGVAGFYLAPGNAEKN